MNRYPWMRGGLWLAIAVAAMLAMAAPAAADVALQDSLISSWAFDDGAASMIVDDPVNGNDATLDPGMGAGNWVGGILGGALHFNGTSDGAAVPNTPSLSPDTTALTVAAWVKLDVLPAELAGGTTGAFGSIYDSLADAYVLYLDKTANELRCKVATTNAGGTGMGAARPGVPAALLDKTNWHHVAGVFDGACVRMYYDGRLVDMQGITGAGGYVLKNQEAAFGMQTDPTGVSTPINRYTGNIDDAAVWSRALGANEIAYLYNAGAGNAVMAANPIATPDPPAPVPVIRMPMDGSLVNLGSGGAAYDGQLVDGPDGDLVYVASKLGQAADLQQSVNNPTSGAYIRVPYTMPEKGTITFWAKPKSFYNYNALLDNSTEKDDWEMWVYATGVARFRIQSDSYVEYDLDNLGGANQWYHFAITWNKAEATNLVGLSMFINGQHVAGDDGAWVAPGSAIGIGGGLLNPGGQVVLDDFRIYNAVLTTEEILAVYNVPEPTTVILLLSVLALLPFGRRRK